METSVNQDLQLAFDFIQHPKRSFFLTGKAGTGKTTFLKSLKLKSPKRMLVVTKNLFLCAETFLSKNLKFFSITNKIL